MSNVKIKGNASGTGNLTIEAPNTNTDRVITLPDEAGTVVTTATDIQSQALGNIPMFKAEGGTGQTINAASFTTVIFNSEVYDPDNLYNPTTGVFQPTVAGYYYLNGRVRINGTVDSEIYDLRLTHTSEVHKTNSANQYRYTSNCVDNIFYFNGTTDNLKVQVYLGGTMDLRTSTVDMGFYGHLVRSA